MSTEGVLKSALLLMSIGEEEAAQVFKFLGPREVQKIGVAMASRLRPASVAWTAAMPPHSLENVGDSEIRLLNIELKHG